MCLVYMYYLEKHITRAIKSLHWKFHLTFLLREIIDRISDHITWLTWNMLVNQNALVYSKRDSTDE